ncbi:MAG: BACON domain-containing protein [Alistipes sp.]|nr:BACON domain-containing protein [Alistipes sp.]
MKKFWNLLLMTFAVVGVVACTEQNPVDEPQAESKLTLVSEASLEFAAEGGEGVIEYTLENAVEGVELRAECEAKWVTNIVVGETITFAVAENEVEEPRETKVVVAYGELSFEVAVNQAAAEPAPVPDPVLTLTSEASLEFAAEGGEGVIEYTLENAVEGVELCAECEAAWVTNIVVGETITFAVAENEVEEPRATKVVVTYGELSFEVAVNQAAAEPAPVPDPVLTLTSAETLEFAADGGEGTIEYTLENAVEGVELRAECEAEWVTNIVVGQTITFAVAENEVEEPRATKIVVAYGELSFEVAVNQAAAEPAPVPDPVLTLTSEASLEFAAEGGEGTIEYTLENAVEGVELRAECEAEWITNIVVGETITFDVVANETIESRQTMIVVAYDSLSFEVVVKQKAKKVGLDGPSYGEEDVEW